MYQLLVQRIAKHSVFESRHSVTVTQTMYELTSGSCIRLHNATSQYDPAFHDNHVLQILSIKPISPPDPNAAPRYRILLSDGVHYLQAMLATELNRYVKDEQIKKHSVIQVSKMSCTFFQNINKQWVNFVDACTPLMARSLIIVLVLDVIGMHSDRINDPQSILVAANSNSTEATRHIISSQSLSDNTSRPHLGQPFASVPSLANLPSIQSPQTSVSNVSSRRGVEEGVDLSEGCFVTKTLKYTHQLNYWINAVQDGDPEPIASIHLI